MAKNKFWEKLQNDVKIYDEYMKHKPKNYNDFSLFDVLMGIVIMGKRLDKFVNDCIVYNKWKKSNKKQNNDIQFIQNAVYSMFIYDIFFKSSKFIKNGG